MSRQSTARNAAHTEPQPQVIAKRDALEPFDRDFLRDQLQALLASPTLSRVAARHSEGRDDPTDFDAADAVTERDADLDSERDTEPNLETLLLREALQRG